MGKTQNGQLVGVLGLQLSFCKETAQSCSRVEGWKEEHQVGDKKEGPASKARRMASRVRALKRWLWRRVCPRMQSYSWRLEVQLLPTAASPALPSVCRSQRTPCRSTAARPWQIRPPCCMSFSTLTLPSFIPIKQKCERQWINTFQIIGQVLLLGFFTLRSLLKDWFLHSFGLLPRGHNVVHSETEKSLRQNYFQCVGNFINHNMKEQISQ